MSDMLQVVLIIFGTVLVTLVAILTGVAVSTLVEVRATARRVREVLDRVAPSAEKTLENVEHVTEALDDERDSPPGQPVRLRQGGQRPHRPLGLAPGRRSRHLDGAAPAPLEPGGAPPEGRKR